VYAWWTSKVVFTCVFADAGAATTIATSRDAMDTPISFETSAMPTPSPLGRFVLLQRPF
jgi:hypothetical protein